jgi:hypothetical protein
MTMNRKTFIKKTVGAVLVTIPAYTLLGCSSDDSASGDVNIDPETKDCLSNGASATAVSSNHGHTLTVAKADIEAGVEKTYSIQGGSTHNHTIVLTTANFNTLKSTKTLKVASSEDADHSHDVTVSCA